MRAIKSTKKPPQDGMYYLGAAAQAKAFFIAACLLPVVASWDPAGSPG